MTTSLSSVSLIRRWVLRSTIGSFSFAALLGVAALLRPGRFGSTEGRILLTTLIVGIASVLMLCYLTATGERSRYVAITGGAAALVATALILFIVWASWQEDPGRPVLRSFGIAAVAAATLAQFSLLLAAQHRRPGVLRLLAGTLVLGTGLAVLITAGILGWDPGDAGGRLIGVVAILDVLGTLVTIALAVFGRDDRQLTVTVPPELAARVLAESEATGRTPQAIVGDALGSYFDVSVG